MKKKNKIAAMVFFSALAFGSLGVHAEELPTQQEENVNNATEAHSEKQENTDDETKPASEKQEAVNEAMKPSSEKEEHALDDEALLLEVEQVLKQYQMEDTTVEEITEISGEEYIPVLMYHHFVKDDIEPGNGATVNIDEFEDHLKTFVEEGYTFINLEEMNEILLQAIDEKEENPEAGLHLDKKYVCITIDDGYRSNYDLAYPLLVKYNAKADISVITCRIHSDYIVASEIEKLSWNDLNKMRESGLVNVYTHTHDHTPANVNDITVFRDSVLHSEKVLDERLTERNNFRVLTYPNGVYTLVSQHVMRQLDYDIQLSTNYGVVTRDTLVNQIPRITVDSGETGEKLIEKIQGAAKKSFENKSI